MYSGSLHTPELMVATSVRLARNGWLIGDGLTAGSAPKGDDSQRPQSRGEEGGHLLSIDIFTVQCGGG